MPFFAHQFAQKPSSPVHSPTKQSTNFQFADLRPESIFQRKLTSLVNVPPFQLKNRIDMSKVGQNKKEEIQQKIDALKQTRRAAKKLATMTWANKQGKDETRDNDYNAEIERIRKEYEEGVIALAKEYNLEETALLSGQAYYGEEVEENNTKFFRRDDVGKEYVQDNRGTFVPRYIRRELNYQDDIQAGLTTKGIGTYGKLRRKKKIGPGGAGELTWNHREFVQQSAGGGDNLFALSHTSTKRPILSNAHESFGQKPEKINPETKERYEHSGAIITDLSKVNKEKLSAQWALDPLTGHKVPLGEGVHGTLDSFHSSKRNSKVKKKGSERDKTVRSSGYRNMEVVVGSVPSDAIYQPDDDWKKEEGPKTDYHSGESKRGNAMKEFRLKRQEEAMEKIKTAAQPNLEAQVGEEDKIPEENK